MSFNSGSARIWRLLLVLGIMLWGAGTAAGAAAADAQSILNTGEGTSPPFSVYLGPGFRAPSGGVGSGETAAFSLYLGRGFGSAGGSIVSSQGAAFPLYLGPMPQGYAASSAFHLDTRLPAALAGVVSDGASGAPIPGAGVELFLGPARQQSTSTNSSGEYTFFATVFGDYVVRAYKEGYAMATSDLVRYSGGATMHAALSLLPVSSLPVPDLAVGPTDLTYTVLQSGRLTLTAMIHNGGGAGASNVRVRFYDASTGSGINNYKRITPDAVIESIPAGAAKPASVTWTPETAHQRFYVFVDPSNEVQESSEINNGADRDLGVLGRVPPRIAAVEARFDGLADPRLIGRFLTGVKGAVNRFTAAVSDPDKDVFRVHFSFDGTVVVDADGSDGWAVDFDTGNLPPGNLPLTVTAYDRAGLTSESFVTMLVIQDWPWWMKSNLELATNFPISYVAEPGYLTLKLRLSNHEYPDQPALLSFSDIMNPDVLIVGSKNTSVNLAGYFTLSYPVDPRLPWKVEGNAHVEGSILEKQELSTDVTITAEVSRDGSVLESISLEYDQQLAIEGFPEVPLAGLVVHGVRVEVGVSMDLLLALHLAGTLAQNLTSMDVALSPQVGARFHGALSVSDLFKFASLELVLSPQFLLGPELRYVYPPGDMSVGGRFSAEVGGELVGSVIWGTIDHTFATWTWGPWEYTYPRQEQLEAAEVQSGVEVGKLNLPEVFPCPSAASNRLGQVAVTWLGDVDPSEERIDPEIFCALRDTLGTWGSSERVTTNDRYETTPVLSFVSDSTAVAVWVQSSLLESKASSSMSLSAILDRQDIWYALRSNTGWSAPAPVVEDSAGAYKADGLPALASLADGGAMLLWTRAEGDSALAPGSGEIYSSVFSGVAWSAPSRLTDDQADDSAPAVCAMSGDSALAVWLREEPAGSGNQRLVWSVWDGSTWTAHDVLRDAGARKQGASLVATQGGGALATWVETEMLPDSTLRYHLLAACKPNGQSQWEAPEDICTDSLFIETPTALVDRRNIAVVAWRGYAGYDGDIKVALKDLDRPGSSWTLPRSVTADTLTDWMATAAIDGQNNLHVIDLKSDLSDTTGTPPRSNFLGGLTIASLGISNDLNLSDGLNFGYRSLSADLLLASGSVTLSNPSPITGDVVLVQAAVKNIGDVRSAPSAVRFYKGRPGSGGVAIGADQALPAIAPDSAAAVSISWVIEAGVYDLWAVADPAGNVPEQNEGNNSAFVSVGVQPDVAVTRLAVSDPNPGPGDSIVVTATVRNSGAASASGFSLRFARPSGRLDVASGLSLSRGDSVAVSRKIAALAGLDTLTAVADPDSVLSDPHRADNAAALVVLCLPDLSIAADSIGYAGTDTSGTLSAVVTNEGGVVSPSFLVSFYRGNPLVDGVLLDSLRVNGLGSHERARVQTAWLAPVGLSMIYAVVDEDDAVTERSKANNESFKDVIRGAMADLAVSAATLRVRHMTDGSISLEGCVSNIGSANALAVGVEFFRGDPDSGGVLIGDRLLLTVDQGQTTVVSVPWAEIDSLDNYVVFVVDRANSISELRETNNRASNQFGAITAVDQQIPSVVALRQAWPNPFNAHTTIRFDLPNDHEIDLAIYDVAGRLIRRLRSGMVPAGTHSVGWDATDERHHDVASGVYFCRLDVEGKVFSNKLVLVR